SREIALPLGQRRHRGKNRRRRDLPDTLPAEEEKGVIPPFVKSWNKYGPAQAGAELVAVEGRSAGAIEKIPRIEIVIAQEFEQRSVKLVAPGFENHRHHAARLASGIRRVTRDLHFEFLQRVEVGRYLQASVAEIPRVESVD